MNRIEALSKVTEAILCAPFEWRPIPGGAVTLEDAWQHGGTEGGDYQVASFAIARYLITNAQYQRFLNDPNGYANHRWWEYSPQAMQWRKDHRNPKPTAFDGATLPRTRVSWFDSMAFCNWLSARLKDISTGGAVRLPTEQEWQRAAVGDTGWDYPWGSQLKEAGGNYGLQVGRPTDGGSYPEGQSPYGVLDMVGNVWEWCLTAWSRDDDDLSSYIYRHIKGGAWNVANPQYLRARDRGGNSPRGQLNDCGFRCAYVYPVQIDVEQG